MCRIGNGDKPDSALPGGSRCRDHSVHQTRDDDRAAQQIAAGDGALLDQGHLFGRNVQPQVASAEDHRICEGCDGFKVLQPFPVLCLQQSRSTVPFYVFFHGIELTNCYIPHKYKTRIMMMMIMITIDQSSCCVSSIGLHVRQGLKPAHDPESTSSPSVQATLYKAQSQPSLSVSLCPCEMQFS